MEVTYSVQQTKDVSPQVSLSYDGIHIGSIFGKIRPLRKDETFGKDNNIITIVSLDTECPIAYIWNAHPEPIALEGETHVEP